MNMEYLERPKVLLAIGHPSIRESSKNIIDRTGEFRVAAEAEDGDMALRMADDVTWDIAIVDFNLRFRRGSDVIHQLRDKWPSRPVGVFSILPKDKYEPIALKAGAAGFLNLIASPNDSSDLVRDFLRSLWLTKVGG